MFEPVDIDRLLPDGPINSPYDQGKAAFIGETITGWLHHSPYRNATDEGKAWRDGYNAELNDYATHRYLMRA